MKKSKIIILIILAISLVFMSACNLKSVEQGLQEQEQVSIPASQNEASGGCDKICDEFEKKHIESPCYNSDCLGISEPNNEVVINQPPLDAQGSININKINSEYKIATNKPVGWFVNNQNADMLLSGVDFNNAGSPLFFNHQGGIATDGQHFIVADRNNNRVLIWNELPTKNVPPDVVLGQKDFITNNPGNTLDKFNWPVGVATDGQHLIVADTYNDRILIWDSFPTENGQAADFEIKGSNNPGSRGTVGWPWSVWTNGEKLIVTSTASSQVLIWNSFPTNSNQMSDIVIKLEDFGTPRTIGSDGTNLIIGDHNAFKQQPGNFFWKSFPTKDDQKYDFFMKTVAGANVAKNEIFWGPSFTSDGKLILISDKLYVWDEFPKNENDAPDLEVGLSYGSGKGYDFSGSQSGDGSGIAIAGEKIYISLCNGNKVVGFNNFPESFDQIPDFVIGSPDINTNTLETKFIISNPVPSTNGNSLFVSSDFDRKLYVWKALPDESGAKPDFVYELFDAPWDNTLYGNILALAGKQTVFVWKKLPLNGEQPDVVFKNKIGNVKFSELIGVAMDENYFYLADKGNNKIYVWKGIPESDSDPVFILECEQPGRLSSDGKHLVMAATEKGHGGSVVIYNVNGLPNVKPTILNGMFNLPQGALVYDNHLFVGDTGFNIVHIWKNIEDAISGKEADIFLGEKGYYPQIKNGKLFWPAVPAFDGSYLWIGEFKFSERLLRFSVKD
ncbi:MAG: hypothetical protein KKB39_01320 [Nanoarchaeota archaeon]|nr:hypothetical protein [Nanoarchaeota archaeon]